MPIQQDGLGHAALGEPVDGEPAVGEDAGAVTGILQIAGQRPRQHAVVVDHDDGRRALLRSDAGHPESGECSPRPERRPASRRGGGCGRRFGRRRGRNRHQAHIPRSGIARPSPVPGRAAAGLPSRCSSSAIDRPTRLVARTAATSPGAGFPGPGEGMVSVGEGDGLTRGGEGSREGGLDAGASAAGAAAACGGGEGGGCCKGAGGGGGSAAQPARRSRPVHAPRLPIKARIPAVLSALGFHAIANFREGNKQRNRGQKVPSLVA